MTITSIMKNAFFIDDEAEKMWDGVKEFIRSKEDFLSFYTAMSEVRDIDVAEDIYADQWLGKEYFEILKRLHEKKYIYRTLLEKNIILRHRPFVIELTGTPRSGKTTTIRNLTEFFKKASFKVVVVEELTTSEYYKKLILPQKGSMSLGEYNLLILEESYKKLMEAINSDADIVLIDRGINDRLVWNYLRLLTGDIDAKKYRQVTKKFISISKKYIDALFVLKTDSQIAVSRDYLFSLCLETRRFNNMSNINRFNGALDAITDVHEEAANNYLRIPANSRSPLDISMIIANKVLDWMLSESLDSVVF